MGGKQHGYRFAEGFAYRDYEQTADRKHTNREMFLAFRHLLQKHQLGEQIFETGEAEQCSLAGMGGARPYRIDSFP